jgi:hypothetical protein
MSDDRFDELSKALATTTSRRQALKILAATAAGGAFSLFGAREARAIGRCRRVGQPCRQDYECCDFFCNPARGRCECPPSPAAHLCAKTRRCIFCNPETSTFDPATCTCVCNEGTTPCNGQCCGEGEECCRGTFFSQCCPTGQCCPSGYCDYGYGC